MVICNATERESEGARFPPPLSADREVPIYLPVILLPGMSGAQDRFDGFGPPVTPLACFAGKRRTGLPPAGSSPPAALPPAPLTALACSGDPAPGSRPWRARARVVRRRFAHGQGRLHPPRRRLRRRLLHAPSPGGSLLKLHCALVASHGRGRFAGAGPRARAARAARGLRRCAPRAHPVCQPPAGSPAPSTAVVNHRPARPVAARSSRLARCALAGYARCLSDSAQGARDQT